MAWATTLSSISISMTESSLLGFVMQLFQFDSQLNYQEKGVSTKIYFKRNLHFCNHIFVLLTKFWVQRKWNPLRHPMLK